MLFCSTKIPICKVIRKGWARLAHHHSDAWYIIVALSIFSDRWRKGKRGDGRKERRVGGRNLPKLVQKHSLTKQNSHIQY